MSQRLIKNLTTLIKIENVKVRSFTVQIEELNQKIALIEDDIKKIDEKINTEKEIIKNDPMKKMAFIRYFDTLEKKRNNLLSEKNQLEKEHEALFEKMLENITQEKAYAFIKDKKTEEIKETLNKKERDEVEDIVSRFV